jgi:hypothetical protein
MLSVDNHSFSFYLIIFYTQFGKSERLSKHGIMPYMFEYLIQYTKFYKYCARERRIRVQICTSKFNCITKSRKGLTRQYFRYVGQNSLIISPLFCYAQNRVNKAIFPAYRPKKPHNISSLLLCAK